MCDVSGVEWLCGVSFILCVGEVLVLVGIDGNGQGELVNIFVGIIVLMVGCILLDGVDIMCGNVCMWLVVGIVYIFVDWVGISLV